MEGLTVIGVFQEGTSLTCLGREFDAKREKNKKRNLVDRETTKTNCCQLEIGMDDTLITYETLFHPEPFLPQQIENLKLYNTFSLWMYITTLLLMS
jgi:hypothetical protein